MKKLVLLMTLFLAIQSTLAQESPNALDYKLYIADNFTSQAEAQIAIQMIAPEYDRFGSTIMPQMINAVRTTFGENELNGCDIDESRFVYTLGLYFGKSVSDKTRGGRVSVNPIAEVVKAELNLKQYCEGKAYVLSDYKEEIVYAIGYNGLAGYDVVKTYDNSQFPYTSGVTQSYSVVNATFLRSFMFGAKAYILSSVQNKFK